MVRAAHCSAQSKSDLIVDDHFEFVCQGGMAGRGALNFFGERQIQSHSPLRGQAPEVSIWVANPAWRRLRVRAVQSCMSGSPPVMTASRPGWVVADRTSSGTGIAGVAGGVPAVFYVAPYATDVAAAEPDEISGFSLVEAFALEGIELFHDREGWPAAREDRCRRGPGGSVWMDQLPFRCAQAVKVFFIRAAMVIGPTPPGTGVI